MHSDSHKELGVSRELWRPHDSTIQVYTHIRNAVTMIYLNHTNASVVKYALVC